MTIIIPMAGLSSRFSKAGYTLPKYMLYVKDKSLFNLAVSSFHKYFASCNFVFVVRDVFDTPRFVKEECDLLGIKQYQVLTLTQPTKGQAETVLKGIEGAHIADNEAILIFNIDTFRFGYTMPEQIEEWDGYLETFVGSGDNWSYARTEDGKQESKVVETAEKRAISQYCSTGMYYFKNASDFISSYETELASPTAKELYVAPLYNHLIHQGKDIHISVIGREEVLFCGVPQEYEEYLIQSIK
jgi:dTDP-glucose pyrophosphorylase